MRVVRSLACLAVLTWLAGCGDERVPVVLISIDGYGAQSRELVETPALDGLAERGIEAEAMRPVFPTLTFPNHYSIATGLYPDEHGLVANHFPNAARDDWYSLYDRTKVEDGRWYGGEPLWVLAERSGLTAAAFFFVGTEADISGIAPTHAYRFDAAIPGEERVEQVLDWLSLPAGQRPAFVTLYFEHVDTASHDYGPASAEAKAAIRRVDQWIARLLEGVRALGMQDEVHVVVVSDHGQGAYVDPSAAFVLDQHLDPDDWAIVEGGTYLHLFGPAERDASEICDTVNAAWEHGNCYTRDAAPPAWRVNDDPRFPDAMLIADEGHAVVSARDEIGKLKPGDHGWPPEAPSMQAIFIAAGPGIPARGRVAAIEAVDVYAFVVALLGIERPVPEGRDDLLQFLERRQANSTNSSRPRPGK